MKLIIFLFLSLPQIIFAQAQVFPTHITLTEDAPSSYLNLRNSTTGVQTYKVELVRFDMAKDGTLSINPKAESNLTDIIKFSPKSITVPPGDKQVVRVMVTTFEELSLGEHHLHVRFVPEAQKDANQDGAGKSRSSMSLQARIAVAVPIVVRKGEGKLQASLEKVKATVDAKDDVTVSMQIKNSSPFYIYGDMEIIGIADKSEFSLDKIIGVGSYISDRALTKVLTKKDIEEKSGGAKIAKIKVLFKSNTESAAPFDLVGESDITKGGTPEKKKKSSKRR